MAWCGPGQEGLHTGKCTVVQVGREYNSKGCARTFGHAEANPSAVLQRLKRC